MLDFYGLHVSYVALFSGGVYMKIESLRLDFHLKRKQKKTTRADVFIGEEIKKKKKPREEGKKTQRRRCSKNKEKKKKKNQMSRDPGGRGARPRSRPATQVVPRDPGAARPGSRSCDPGGRGATWVAAPAWIWRGLGLELISISSSSSSSSSSSLSFFFFFLSAFSSAVSAFWVTFWL